MSNNLADILTENSSFNKLLKYHQRHKAGIISGLEGSSLSLFMMNFKYRINDNILILTTSRKEADNFYHDLMGLLDPSEVFLLPELEVLPHEALSIEKEVKGQRLEVLNNLLTNNNRIYIAPITAILTYLPNREQYYKQIESLKLNDKLNIKRLNNKLVKLGYNRVKKTTERGEFSIRGGIIDIYPLAQRPVRIELFGEQIDSIRYFDPLNQRSKTDLEQFILYPAKELIIPDDNDFVADIKRDLVATKKGLDKSAKKNLTTITETDLEKFKEGIEFPEQRKYMKYFNQVDTFFAYFSGTVTLYKPNKIKQRAYDYLESVINRYDTLLNEGKVLKDYKELFIDFNELMYNLEDKVIYLSPTAKNLSAFSTQFNLEVNLARPESFQGKIDLFIKKLSSLYHDAYKVAIAFKNLARAEKFKNRLKDNNLPCIVAKDIATKLKAGNIILTDLSLQTGVESKEDKFVLYTEQELLKKRSARRSKEKNYRQGAPIESFTELDEGDYVVHENHGIARYLGIETLKVQNKSRDYLLLLYAGDDRLYVPTDKVDLIQKYVALKDRKPRLHKLDGDSWQKAKARVKKSVEEMAEELLELYAKREMKRGYSFGPDTSWQQEFEAEFPYQETKDQLKAIEAVKDDMQSEQPMDRLICGDVGYGKTEVAIRAIFKAIMDGKQAAFLVPTTILAQQHWNNIADRFKKYPIKVEMLSRFRTAGEQREVIKSLKQGRVDLVVGTHRLLSQDIEFNDLGLLVVDEEQRFGVKQKERLKQFKESIDVLTLSATPIPRTLHMSLVGVRDISLIETPPENRYPIRTFVGEYQIDLVKEAIYRELSRGGQIYFVHNRVKDIKKKAKEIKTLFPEAEVMIAHGQMREKKLERIMLDFLEGNYDILVCTTIIENGMDISNVNTIIINRADCLGLSQLYQLRGRVGRSNRVAYSYLLYEKDKILSEVAEKRLKAINEFTNLGSGFKIAMRDLEIRGAGNILGPEQHGHIEAIGFSLYCKLLEDAVERLKNKQPKKELECNLELKVNAYLPSEYIPDSKQKIELYKRIEQIKDKQAYNNLLEELKDRFGLLPQEVELLLQLAKIRFLAAKIGFYEIKEKKGTLYLRLFEQNLFSPTKLLDVVAEFDNLKLVANKKLEIKGDISNYKDKEKVALIFELLTLLNHKSLKEKTG